MVDLTEMCILCVGIFLVLNYGVTAQECQVDRLNVQSEFDFEKYMGKWYEISWYSDIVFPQSTWFTDYKHHYVQTGAGSASAYIRGRFPLKPLECDAFVHTLSTTDTPGKLLYTSAGGSVPYWVLETDYTQYAFVYGCYNVSASGTCNGARAWIWSRTKTLSNSVINKTVRFYQNICIQESSFEKITNNNECSVRTHWRLRTDQGCSVSDITVQENFDITKYAGTWYETRWLAPFSIPANQLFQDYQHHYVITEDGNMTGYIYGRAPDNPDQCFYNAVGLQRSQMPGKLIYDIHSDSPVPYWVIRTDYTQYAVVYSCYNVSSDGSCYEARSWVWSRTPNLPKQLVYEVNTLLQNICVNPSAYLSTEQLKLCPLKPTWNLLDKLDCNVTSFSVKPNFDINMLTNGMGFAVMTSSDSSYPILGFGLNEQLAESTFTNDLDIWDVPHRHRIRYASSPNGKKHFTRVWYETRWLPKDYPSPSEMYTDRLEEVFVSTEGDITSYTRYRKGNSCNYSSTVYKKTDTPGKFVSTETDSHNFWVVDTDYDTYAVIYGCESVGSDGGCLSARGSVWSRTPTLASHLQYHANSVLQGLCINPSALDSTTQENACPPQGEKTCTVDQTSSAAIYRSHLMFIIVPLAFLTP